MFLYLRLQLTIGCNPEYKDQNLYPLETANHAQNRWQSEMHGSARFTEADLSELSALHYLQFSAEEL